MKTIYLVRHGQTDANKNKIWIGARESYKLNTEGRVEAMIAGVKLRDLDLKASAIYSSTAERAFQTAEIIADKLDLPIIPVPSLLEMHFGKIEGLDEVEFKSQYPDDYKEWQLSTKKFAPQNGESGVRFMHRAIRVVKDICFEADTQDVLIITHSGIVKMFLANILKLDLDIGWRYLPIPKTPTGSITKFIMKDNVFFYQETYIEEGQIDG